MLVGSSFFFKKKAFDMGFDIFIFLCGGYPNVGLWSILQVLNITPTNFDTFFSNSRTFEICFKIESCSMYMLLNPQG
jgi:hypothetical protein